MSKHYEEEARIASENQGFPYSKHVRVGSRMICAAEGETPEISEANAQRIVLAWNCHDELVEALLAARHRLQIWSESDSWEQEDETSLNKITNILSKIKP